MPLLTPWSMPALVSLAVLLVSLTALLFSPYRRWVAFMLAGMGYFALLKALASGLSLLLGWTLLGGYSAAFAASLLMLGVWLGRHTPQAPAEARLPVEHQPIRIQEIN